VLQTLLCLLPIAALALPLLARRYPGERAIRTLRGARTPLRSLRCAPAVRSYVDVVLAAVSGGRLIGCSLAVRPPPAPAAAS
jgi:hypothetical protein